MFQDSFSAGVVYYGRAVLAAGGAIALAILLSLL